MVFKLSELFIGVIGVLPTSDFLSVFDKISCVEVGVLGTVEPETFVNSVYV